MGTRREAAPGRRPGSRRPGQGLVEYVLIAGLVAIGLVLALTFFRNGMGGTLDNANAGVSSGTMYVPGSGGAAGGANGGRGGGTGGGQGSGRGGGQGSGT